MTKILLEDDSKFLRMATERALARAGYQVSTAEDGPSVLERAKREKPDVILLAHGAALVDPSDAQYMLDHTDCDGVQLGSSIERMAIENPLRERTAAFKAVHFGSR